jgi:antitoxin VapB
MTKQLNIRNDEVYRLAHKLAAEMGKPVTEAMLIVLRAHDAKLPAVDELTSSQRATYERLQALSKESAKHRLPGATSDHGDLYDDFGLPK